jgi:capsular polysaccharide biosynthesis protein
MNEKREITEINLKRTIRVLLKRAWIILLVGVLFAAMAFSYAFFMVTPTYAASVQLYVNNTYGAASPGFSSSQLMAAQDLADTYMVILRSRPVLEEVAKRTDLGYHYSQIRGMLSSATVNGTEVFRVTVLCENYIHAAKIADAIADVLPEQISAIVDGSSVKVVERAVPSGARVAPDYKEYAVMGLLLGAMLTAAVIILLDLMDNTIDSADYLTQQYQNLPLLAVVPDGDDHQKNGYYKGYYASGQRRQSPKKSGGKK